MDIDWLEDMSLDLERKAQLASDFADRVAGIEAKASSPDGSVEVTVNSRGTPTGIKLSEAVRGREPRQIAAEIMTTLGKAQHRLSADLASLTEYTFGANSPMAYEVNDELTRQYGDFEAERGQR